MQQKKYTTQFDGRELTATFSDLADQTNGSVMIQYGETIVLATTVMNKHEREGVDFFPLVVDYEEKHYAAGKILGGQYMKREGRPSDEAVLTGRIVDRTIRPFFDQRMRHEVQVVLTTLSIDEHNDTDVPAVLAASLALATSDIPWNGPLSAVRLGLPNPDAEFVINPSYQSREDQYLDLLVCGKDHKIAMIEMEGKEVKEDILSRGMENAIKEIAKLQAWQEGIVKEIGKPKREIVFPIEPAPLRALFNAEILPKMKPEIYIGHPGKGAITKVHDIWKEMAAEKFPEAPKDIVDRLFEDTLNDLVHKEALELEERPDGRKLDELRPIFAQAGGLSSVLHGSGIFYRGGTHILSVLTLGGPKDAQMLDGMEVRGEKYFMHHYNFPPYSVGETGRMGGINRRSVGHGALAEKSLKAVLPSRDIFPYTIRLVSEALASNGSTSMGSACASSLALMDGGVPITRPVAGIAIGLMSDEKAMAENKDNFAYKILTDIQGPEDHHGDMDFKVAGTTEGVTGIQLDIKVGGIPVKILSEGLTKAKAARLQILSVMTAAIAAPRSSVKPSAPGIIQMRIPVDKIGAVIGPGGKIIQKLCKDTGAEIDISDDGTVVITGSNDGAEAARATIADITREYKPGEKFEGEVTRLMDFGAFVKIGRDAEGLVHISELAPFRVNKVTDIVALGERVPVMIKEIDEKGRINLSLKNADPDFAKKKVVTYNDMNGTQRPGTTSDPNRPPINPGGTN